MEGPHPALTFALALAVGVAAQSAARHIRVPGIVMLLVAGAALGPGALGWVRPRDLGDGLFAIVDLAVAVILFEGGLNLSIARLRREQAAIRRLVTAGALVTLVGGTLAVRGLLPDWSLQSALLFGSLVVVTGPTVVGPLVRSLRLRRRVATVLEAEGVLIDPIGAILAVLVLELVLTPSSDAIAGEALELGLRLGFGAAAGALSGLAIAALLRARNVVPEGLENIFVLASVLLVFEGSDAVVAHSGILAVTIAGVAVGNQPSRVDRDLREFKDQLTIMLIGLLFVLLAADVGFAELRALGLRGLGVVAALVLVVRPLGVWLSTLGSELSLRERLFVAWIAPRGIVAAAIASITASALDGAGLTGGAELRALVFLTISVTVLLAGLTAGIVARLLGLCLPSRDSVAILGAHAFALALADELRKAGTPVVLLDSNPQHCRAADEAGLPVVFGNALQERTLQRARFDEVGTAVGLTANGSLNGAFVARARELFRVPRAYVAVLRGETGLAAELVRNENADALFEDVHDVERWEVRARRGDVAIEHWVYGGAPAESVEGDEARPQGERLAILTLKRGGRTRLMSSREKLEEGDEVAVAVHVPERDEAQRALRRRGFEPAPESDGTEA